MEKGSSRDLTTEIASKLTLCVKDTSEIKKSAWYEVATIDKMYASHKDWLDKVHADYKAKTKHAFRPFTSNDASHDVKYPFVSHQMSLGLKPPPPSPILMTR